MKMLMRASFPPLPRATALLHRLVHGWRRVTKLGVLQHLAPPRPRWFRSAARPSARAISCCARGRRSMPRATSSQRVIPPKMLTRIAFTFGSARMMRIAAPPSPDSTPRRCRGSWPARRRVLHEVHRRHREAAAVDHAADVAIELDEREVRSDGPPRRRDPPRRDRAVPPSPGGAASAESSSVILASRQTSRSTGAPPAVCSRITARGLISTRSASLAIIVRSRPFAIAAPAFQCAPNPILNASSRAAWSGRPSNGSVYW